MTRLAIFDLDGTLLNTIGDLAVSCNAVLALRGLPQHSYEDYCRFVGNGIMRLVERALPKHCARPTRSTPCDAISWRIISRISTNIRSLTREFPNCWPSCSGGACGWPSRRTSSRPAPRSSSAAISPTSASTWFWGSVPTCRSNPIRRSSARSLTATGVAAGEVLYVGDSGGGHADGRRRRRPFGGRHVGVPHACRVGAERCPAHRRPPCGVARTVVIFPVGSSEPDSSLIINGKRNLREIPFSVL